MQDVRGQDRLIFALDLGSSEEAKEWVNRLKCHVRWFKVGLELFSNAGPDIVKWIVDQGLNVMLDLKFFDVPATVRRAVLQFKGSGIRLLTVHAVRPVMEAAVDADPDFSVLAVTVLTSLSKEDLYELGLPQDGKVSDLVLKKACAAKEAGVGGVVCSALEAGLVRERLGADFLIVTPGIRPSVLSVKIEDEDQVRVATPGGAIANGADLIVVGRPIRDAKDPLKVVQAIKKEILEKMHGSLDK